MKIKNIIWDWNGTVVDDAWVFVEIMNNMLKKHFLPPISLQDYKERFCFPIQVYWKGLGFSFTDESFNELNKDFIKQYQQKMFLPKIHESLIGLFDYIKKNNVRQFVLSASEQKLLNKSIKHYGLIGIFDAVYGVDNLNADGKLALGRALCEEYKIKAEETLLIGDTEYDRDVAIGLGCRVFLVDYGHINYSRLFKTGEFVVSSVGDLKKTLERSLEAC